MSLDPDERARRLAEASRVLRDGGCVVMPTETVYGVFTRASDEGAEYLEQLTGKPRVINTPPFTLHLGDAEPTLSMLSLESPVARRLVNRLTPGPVRLVVRQPESVLEAICESVALARPPDRPSGDSGQRASGTCTRRGRFALGRTRQGARS